MLYFGTVPRQFAEDYEFDGEHANCCSICRYHGNCLTGCNELGVYYEPPLDCDDKDNCKNWYETFVKQYRKCLSRQEVMDK